MASGGLRRIGRDLTATALTATIYSFALGVAIVTMPLLALRAGYSASAIGVLTALSAIAQMASRLALTVLMRRFSDVIVVAGAGFLLFLSSTTLALSTALVPFVVAELLQGASRGCFWTGVQTHVVRGPGPSVRRLATVNFMSSLGLLGGPTVAGLVGSVSLRAAAGASAATAVIALLPTLGVRRFPPFVPGHGHRTATVWLRPGVDIGCAAGVTAGSWRALLSSYVPVALEGAGQGPAVIGGLVSAANAASVAGSVVAAKSQARQRFAFVTATVVAGAAVAGAGYAASVTAYAAVLLVVSGLGAGVLQTLGPASAAEAVGVEERGDAIAVTGAFRAGALFLAPLAVGGLLVAVPLDLALLALGLAVTAPALVARRSPRGHATTSVATGERSGARA